MLMQAKRLAHCAAHDIARHRVTDGFGRDRQTQPCWRRRLRYAWFDRQHKHRIRDPAAARESRIEVAFAQQFLCASQP